jgi:class 3 adenylate cyclase/dienelactone hydrolase
MSEFPETQYTASDGLSIAYQIWGEGPNNLVVVPGIISHLEAFLEIPEYVHYMRSLSAHFRLVTFDKRGGGMSDRISGAPTLDERTRDIDAVMDAAKIERTALAGFSEGAPMSMLFAARDPQRVSKLIIGGGFAAGRLARGEYSLEEHEAFLAELRDNWGKPDGEHYITRMVPQSDDPELRAQIARGHRMCATPTSIAALSDLNARIDVRDILPSIQQPTLVLRREAEYVPRQVCQYITEHIPDAQYQELPGNDHPLFFGDADAYVEAIRDFVLGDSEPVAAPSVRQRVLASVLFTDIVGSTEHQVQLGDDAYRQLMNRHDDISKRQIERCNGRFIHGTGDGLLATFTAPTDAITCAAAIRDAMTSIDLTVRAGVHTGEIELRGDDISGISVNIASRIADHAGESEILTSDLTRQLMIGSNAIFEDRGEFELKGVPGNWPLYAASLG